MTYKYEFVPVRAVCNHYGEPTQGGVCIDCRGLANYPPSSAVVWAAEHAPNGQVLVDPRGRLLESDRFHYWCTWQTVRRTAE